MEAASGIVPTVAADKAATGLSVSTIQAVLGAYRPVASLDEPIDGDSIDDDTIGDEIPDGLAQDPTEIVCASLTRGAVETFLEILPKRERRVLRLRFGFVDDSPRMMKEIASEFGVTRERVRQLKCQGLDRLRKRAVLSELRQLIDYPALASRDWYLRTPGSA